MLLKYNRVLSIRDCPYAFFSTCPEWQAIFAFAPPLTFPTFICNLCAPVRVPVGRPQTGFRVKYFSQGTSEKLSRLPGVGQPMETLLLKEQFVWGRTWNAGLRSDPLAMCSPARFVGPRKSLNIKVCRSSFIIQQKPAVYLSDLQFTAGSRATASSKEKNYLDMIFLGSSIWYS